MDVHVRAWAEAKPWPSHEHMGTFRVPHDYQMGMQAFAYLRCAQDILLEWLQARQQHKDVYQADQLHELAEDGKAGGKLAVKLQVRQAPLDLWPETQDGNVNRAGPPARPASRPILHAGRRAAAASPGQERSCKEGSSPGRPCTLMRIDYCCCCGTANPALSAQPCQMQHCP